MYDPMCNCPKCQAGEPHDPAMSLRDWFAGLAMQGYLSSELNPGDNPIGDEYLSKWSYATADAMLKERGKE